jgi:hypothetical protein
MFGLFGKKEETLDENTVLIAGITAGIAFKLMEKKFGMTPVNETPKILDGCKKSAYEKLSINPNEQSRLAIHMVTLTFAMDESGLAQKIANRYEQGDTSIYPEEAQMIWDLTMQKSKEAAHHLSSHGKR